MFAGSRQMQIEDRVAGLSFAAFVFYPTREPSTPTPMGPYVVDVRPDAAVADGHFPLVVVSHGSGGSPLSHRTLGVHLAKNGYVVALIEHAGNNRNDDELNDTHENLEYRPRHVRLLVDAVLADARLGGRVGSHDVAMIGHSMGGYTALAAAGGRPWSEDIGLREGSHAGRRSRVVGAMNGSRTKRRVEVTPDPRVRALVLLAPATAWYLVDDSLRPVDVPILMLAGEHDEFAPRWHADVVLDGVADRSRVTFRVVENAGHFSFLSPFPPAMRSEAFLPSNDPDGFDREEFQRRLEEEVLAFLERELRKG